MPALPTSFFFVRDEMSAQHDVVGLDPFKSLLWAKLLSWVFSLFGCFVKPGCPSLMLLVGTYYFNFQVNRWVSGGGLP